MKLEAPETFEEVAVDFSREEWKLLSKEEKQLHQEVMVQNYDHMVSLGYIIPVEQLLLIIEKPDGLPFNVREEDVTVPQLCLPTSSQMINRCLHLNHSIGSQPSSDQNQQKSDCCNKAFPGKLQTHSEEKPYKCVLCDKSFAQKSYLAKHEKMHTGMKPYKCKTCDKSFTQKNILSAHEKIHSGSKPFKCATCDKCFIHKFNLSKHERIHTGERPYRCEICSKTFTQKITLLEHERIHTGEKPYKCSICGKSCRQKSNLSVHEKIHLGKAQRCFIWSNEEKQKQKQHHQKQKQLIIVEKYL